MSRLTFQIGKEVDRNSNVLTWRLPKRTIPNKAIVLEQETEQKPRTAFGRRAIPPTA